MRADAKDKHVLAAAVHSESTVLVTENVKDFHPPTNGPHAMPVQKTSQFLSQLVADNPGRAVAAMKEMIGRTSREPNTLPDLIAKLAAQQPASLRPQPAKRVQRRRGEGGERIYCGE